MQNHFQFTTTGNIHFNQATNSTTNSNVLQTGDEVGFPVVKKNSIKLCKRRKARTVFSDHQLNGLEKRFESQKYLSTPERVELANSLCLSETQVIRTFY